ncbi:hypothetical protein ACTXT7_017246 [Hymenolepis weldensis]
MLRVSMNNPGTLVFPAISDFRFSLKLTNPALLRTHSSLGLLVWGKIPDFSVTLKKSQYCVRAYPRTAKSHTLANPSTFAY